MEKTITINSPNSNIPEKKLTQTNAAKKAAVQSILEKYNLKTPKKSKTNAVPVEYEIKPKDASQIIHVRKSAPSTPNQSCISYSSTPVEPHNIKIESSNVRETKSAPTSPHLESFLAQSREPTPTKQLGITDKSSISEKAKMVSVKELLERDKVAKEAKKNEMPPAIIQKSSGGGGGTQDKINIYNFIPKVRHSLPETPTAKQTEPSNRIISSISNSNSVISRSSPNNNVGNIKRVSINPNLNEEESLNYTGSETKSSKASEELAARVLQEARSRTPSPIRNIQNEKQNARPNAQHNAKHNEIFQKSIDYNLPPREQRQAIPIAERTKQIQIQTSASGGGGKQSRALRTIQPQAEQGNMEGENPELSYLEAQRKELQRQQLLELQRFKQKKAEIIKLNNRKKEIELMRSIEAEKNKLRKIHAKQQELNEIYKTAVEKDSASRTQSGGTTMKRLVTNDFDVDAKRTKKNLMLLGKNKFIEPTDNAHIKSGKLKSSSVVDKIFLEETKKQDITSKQDESNVEVVEIRETHKGGNKKENIEITTNNKEQKELKELKDKTKESSKTKIKKELIPGEPLKYYTRKDKINISWPSKAELYDVNKFEDTLDIFLGMEPFLNRKQGKIKTIIEEINKELKEEYGFQKLEKFKPALLDVIYKIIIGDKIKFIFE